MIFRHSAQEVTQALPMLKLQETFSILEGTCQSLEYLQEMQNQAVFYARTLLNLFCQSQNNYVLLISSKLKMVKFDT